MTQTIDEIARELLARQCEGTEYAKVLRKGKSNKYLDGSDIKALAALTEALTRVEELETERNAGGFVGINSVMNEKLRDANETICEQRTRVEELEGAVRFYAEEKNWRSPSSGFALQYDPEPSPINKDRGNLARTTLSKGITE